jgi:hypothetical protein
MLKFKNKQKEGYLFKQSRHLKQWRKRWFILDDNKLYSFKDKDNTKDATETIDLKVFSSVKSSEDYTGKPNSFDVYSPDFIFSMAAENETDKEDWIRAIGRAIVMSHTKLTVDNEDSEKEESDGEDE